MKKIFFLLYFLIMLLPLAAQAQSKTEINFFYSDTCPHCHKEAFWLDKMAGKYGSQLTINRYEVTKNFSNAKLFVEFGQRLNADVSGVPFTVIGDKYFVGFADEDTSGKAMEAVIKNLIDQNNADVPIVDDNPGQSQPDNIPDAIKVPIFGAVDLKKLSLPAITVLLGALDGFNPCAMWTLAFLISLLLGMADKKRMWILGLTFIGASGAVYFMFMAAWLHLILFLGFVVWIRILIGLVALGGGFINVRSYFKNKAGYCKVTDAPKRRQVFDKLKAITQKNNLFLALVGIILLAFTVNLVEAICSAGLPAVFAQVLAINNLNAWQYYGYILLYLFFFMLDDILVFFIAMITLQLTGLSNKYSRWSSLIGGTLMLIIGILLIFKPQWLMFT